jgi:hypothetical protein
VRPQKRGKGVIWGMSSFMEKSLAILETTRAASQGMTSITALEALVERQSKLLGQIAMEELSKEQAAQLFPPKSPVSDLRNPTEKP